MATLGRRHSLGGTLPLTFQLDPIKKVLDEVQGHARNMILGEPDLRIFLQNCLRLGMTYYRAPNSSPLLGPGLVNVLGGFSLRKEDRATAMVLASYISPGRDVIHIFRGLAGGSQLPPKFCWPKLSGGPIIKGQFGISHMTSCPVKNISKNELSDKRMPLYITFPILKVYAEERLSGKITYPWPFTEKELL